MESCLVAPGHAPWHLHFCTLPSLRVVSLLYGYWVDTVVEPAQCDCMDEEQAIFVPPGVPHLHLDRHSRTALLGGRNLR